MIYKSKRSETKQKVLIHLFITYQALHQEYDSTSELFFFMLHYSFLLQDNEINHNSCDLKTNHFLVSQGNGENGARYLDPKYSRWISVDPALGEYIPAAGKGTSEEAGKLPGMGGIYNHLNAGLYHYAGNNPVRYIDPDGRVFKFDDNSSQDFKKDFMLSLKYLMQSETGSAIIKELQSSDTVFTIKECTWINSSDSAEGADFFDPKTNTIYWSGKWTLLAKNGNYNSPAICLMHELRHAWEKRTKTGMATYQKFINNKRKVSSPLEHSGINR